MGQCPAHVQQHTGTPTSVPCVYLGCTPRRVTATCSPTGLARWLRLQADAGRVPGPHVLLGFSAGGLGHSSSGGCLWWVGAGSWHLLAPPCSAAKLFDKHLLGWTALPCRPCHVSTAMPLICLCASPCLPPSTSPAAARGIGPRAPGEAVPGRAPGTYGSPMGEWLANLFMPWRNRFASSPVRAAPHRRQQAGHCRLGLHTAVAVHQPCCWQSWCLPLGDLMATHLHLCPLPRRLPGCRLRGRRQSTESLCAA